MEKNRKYYFQGERSVENLVSFARRAKGCVSQFAAACGSLCYDCCVLLTLLSRHVFRPVIKTIAEAVEFEEAVARHNHEVFFLYIGAPDPTDELYVRP